MYAATEGPNVKWGGTDFKWGPGTTGPPAGDCPGYSLLLMLNVMYSCEIRKATVSCAFSEINLRPFEIN